jgi:hypothetical protein
MEVSSMSDEVGHFDNAGLCSSLFLSLTPIFPPSLSLSPKLSRSLLTDCLEQMGRKRAQGC